LVKTSQTEKVDTKKIMTPAQFLLKMLILSASAEMPEGASITYVIDLEEEVISGEFSFPIKLDTTDGDLSLKTTDWLKVDFSHLLKGEIE
jgi:hypothetical protein